MVCERRSLLNIIQIRRALIMGCNNNCFGGNNCLWIILLIIIIFSCGCGNGCGCNNGCGNLNGGCGC
jgi:hypothetical protein